MRILVVDDEADMREVAQLSLEMVGGWSVSTAASGEEAIRIAVRDRPDAILMDVMMPDADGPETVARLRASEETRHIPVVLLTAKSGEADVRRLESLDVVGVLAKPFDPMRLPAQLAKVLKWTS
jgi:CheY-like chemotaxis protein